MEDYWGIIVIAIWLLLVYGGFRLFRYILKLGREGRYAPYISYYSVPMPPNELYGILSEPINFDEWQCKLTEEQDILSFYHYSGLVERRFELRITDMGRFSVVSLGMLNMGPKGVSVNTDAFMQTVFRATIIPNENMHPNQPKTEEEV